MIYGTLYGLQQYRDCVVGTPVMVDLRRVGLFAFSGNGELVLAGRCGGHFLVQLSMRKAARVCVEDFRVIGVTCPHHMLVTCPSLCESPRRSH